ncbi:hypothetical protein B0H19DRAFT_681156 [Mycena capillaripes]|nr:hypothetical protein B0H19DRAFT_681156 [Mycena capillaripes]
MLPFGPRFLVQQGRAILSKADHSSRRPRLLQAAMSVSEPSLPPELWLFIHRLALSDISPLVEVYSEDEIIQYSTTPDYPLNYSQLQRFLEAARSLGCVCRLWSRLAQEFLYENIWVDDQRWSSLSLALEQPHIARRVRSVRLSSTHFDYNALVLQRCGPHIEVLVLHESPYHDREISLPLLPSLRRLYWAETSSAAPLLGAVVSAAPNLEHLSLTSTWSGYQVAAPASFPPLLNLHSLALVALSTPYVQALLRTDMPQLVRLTIAPVYLVSGAFPFLPALHTLILAGASSTPFPAILRHCPALRELRYNTFWRATPPEVTQTAAKLSCVRLYLSSRLPISTEMVERNAAALLIRPAFAALQRVVLDGSAWGAFENRCAWAQLRGRGCRVEAGLE